MTAAIIAHEQNPATGMLYSILIDGLDVARMVDFSSVRVTEAGPGAVSSMSFTIKDPQKLVTIADAAYIQSWDYTRDLPVFTGFVQTQSSRPGYGGAGRDIDVTCYGIEAILDQVIVPSLTARTTDVDASGFPETAAEFLQVIASNTPLRAGTEAAPFNGNQADPVGSDGLSVSVNTAVDGMSIRTAFEAYVDACISVTWAIALTVDPWRGIRKYTYPPQPLAGSDWPADYATLTIVETPTGTAAATLTWTRDSSPGDMVTAVYVKGGNAAGTGWVVGDTSQGRTERGVSDSAVLSEDAKQRTGRAILNRVGTGSGRGTLVVENFTPINAHAGGPLTITNAALGWSAKSFAISQIDKTFNVTGSQNWTVSFFDVNDAPSAGAKSLARTLRSITRTLS